MDFSKILSQSSWIQQDWTLCYIKKCFCHENMEHTMYHICISDKKFQSTYPGENMST